jgi:predicted phosphodiesterase
MRSRRMRLSLGFASLAIVLVAAGLSIGPRWNTDFAQYKGTPRPPAQDEFRFVIVGDRTGGAQWGMMPQAFREINLLDPDFVISVGDLIDGYGDDEDTVNGIWDEFDKTEMPVLKVPFVYMPGNHDIFNATSKLVYEKRYGPRFRSFNYRGLHFITLNTQESAGTDYRFRGRGADALGEEQLAWLKDDLERNRNARRILIFMHQPTWNALEPFYPLLEGLPVNVFAGHLHKYSYQEIHGIPHIICGATAAFIPEEGNEAYGRFRSYLMATVRDDQFKLAMIRLGGVINPKQIMEKDQTTVRRLADATAIIRDSDDPTTRARVVFRNPMSMPVRIQIVKATRGSSKHLFDGDEPSVEPGQTFEKEVDWSSFAGRGNYAVEYRVVYRFDNSGGEYQNVDFPIDVKPRRSVLARAVAAAPNIDGDLSEWSGAKWQTLNDRSFASLGSDAWDGPEDLSAQFSVAEDDANIYVAIRVTDDTIAYSGSPADGDSVELFTADPRERGISFSADSDLVGLVIAPFSSASNSDAGAMAGTARLRKIRPPGIWGGSPTSGEEFSAGRAAFVRDAKHYSIEVALPRSAIGWDNGNNVPHQLDIGVNDRDSGDHRETQLMWAGTDRDSYSSRYYGTVQMP